MKIINTDRAPAAIGPYSQAIATGKLLYTSGQIPIDPATGNVQGATMAEQAEQVLKNLQAVLTAAGASLDTVVKTTCFITNMDEFASFNEVYSRFFVANKPGRSCVEVSRLPKGVLCEVEAIAELP